MSGRRYITLVLVGLGAIMFDVLMLGYGALLAVALAFGIIAATMLIELAIGELSRDDDD